MKSRVSVFSLAVLVAAVIYAQRFPTNNISQEEAIKVASHLWLGMNIHDVDNIVEKTNGLKGARVGSPVSGWTSFYVLSNGCHLNLEFRPKGTTISDSNFWLSAAFISHGEKLVTITLTNAPQRKIGGPR